MKTVAKNQSKQKEQKTSNGAATDVKIFTAAGGHQVNIPTPDYTKMMAAIAKVSHPVPFEEIKVFYGLH